jgi:hypothetical protein
VAVVGEDWGQDMKGLGKFCQQKGIKKIWYNPYGAGMPSLYRVPHQTFPCNEEFSGWIAVHLVDLYRPHTPGCYDWIKKYDEPLKKIGHSIYIYQIPEE